MSLELVQPIPSFFKPKDSFKYPIHVPMYPIAYELYLFGQFNAPPKVKRIERNVFLLFDAISQL